MKLVVDGRLRKKRFYLSLVFLFALCFLGIIDSSMGLISTLVSQAVLLKNAYVSESFFSNMSLCLQHRGRPRPFDWKLSCDNEAVILCFGILRGGHALIKAKGPLINQCWWTSRNYGSFVSYQPTSQQAGWQASQQASLPAGQQAAWQACLPAGQPAGTTPSYYSSFV